LVIWSISSSDWLHFCKIALITSIVCWVITFCAKIYDGGRCNLGF